jgi:hypothetical protein
MLHTDNLYRKAVIRDKYIFLIFYYINKFLNKKDIKQMFHSKSEEKCKICIFHWIHKAFISDKNIACFQRYIYKFHYNEHMYCLLIPKSMDNCMKCIFHSVRKELMLNIRRHFFMSHTKKYLGTLSIDVVLNSNSLVNHKLYMNC